MARWPIGERTVRVLIDRGRLERIEDRSGGGASTAIDRAARRLRTAAAGLELGDADGADAAAYDAYRMAGEALLIRQGLRSTGGEGSHTVEDAVAAQSGGRIDHFAVARVQSKPSGRSLPPIPRAASSASDLHVKRQQRPAGERVVERSLAGLDPPRFAEVPGSGGRGSPRQSEARRRWHLGLAHRG